MKYIRKFNESSEIFTNLINSNIQNLIENIEGTLQLKVKNKEAAEKELLDFIGRNFGEENKDNLGNENGPRPDNVASAPTNYEF